MNTDDRLMLELNGIYPLDAGRGIEHFVDRAADDLFRSEFFYADTFDAGVIAEYFYNGLLPMAMMLPSGVIAHTPKLHLSRCALDFADLHIERGLRKKLGGLTLSIDSSIIEVIRGCLARHGASWLYPPLLNAFLKLSRGDDYPARVHSVELRRDGALIAGEIGCTVGRCYTSLSGFHTIDSSGSIQLAALGALLDKMNFEFWDLGMYMPYKERLGAVEISAEEFIRRLRGARDERPDEFTDQMISVRELII